MMPGSTSTGALLRLATYAWMEGHVEGYDRAMKERAKGG